MLSWKYMETILFQDLWGLSGHTLLEEYYPDKGEMCPQICTNLERTSPETFFSHKNPLLAYQE